MEDGVPYEMNAQGETVAMHHRCGTPLAVLMFCTQFRPMVGGAERQAEKLARALVRQGHKVTVLTPHWVADTPATEEVHGLTIRRFPLFDFCRKYPSIRGAGIFNFVSLALQVQLTMQREIKGHDIVHAHGAGSLTAFALSAAKRRGVPFVCKLASSGSGFDLTTLAGIGLGGKALARQMAKKVNTWIATTLAVREALIGFGIEERKIVHLPNGVELPPAHKESRESLARRFLYVGRISRACDRDFDSLVSAFKALAAEIPDVELALVGGGDLQERVGQALSGLKVHMPGLVAEPSPWYTWADSFVLPSRREGMSNALIEAMSHGLICIANDIPANREVLDDGKAGLLAEVGSVKSLLSVLRQAASAPGFAGLGKIALAAAKERYGVDAVAEKTVAVYRAAILNNRQKA